MDSTRFGVELSDVEAIWGHIQRGNRPHRLGFPQLFFFLHRIGQAPNPLNLDGHNIPRP